MSTQGAFKNPVKIQLSNGEDLELPRLTLGKLNAVAGSIAALVKAIKAENPDLLNFDDFETNPTGTGSKILQAVPALLPTVSSQVISLVAIYLGKEEEWVTETMDLEDLSKVVLPFFMNILKQGNLVFAAFKKVQVPK